MVSKSKIPVLTFSIFIFSIYTGFSQKKILIYHETNGFRHANAITEGITMFENLGNSNSRWTTDNSQDSSVFNTTNLNQYDAVVFLNTSGNNLLNTTEQQAFENFIKSGKGFIGIHAATDTYRDKSWDFYNELVGAIVQTSPNHTANNFNADMEVKVDHPLISFLSSSPPVVGSIWNKNEEYYYWEQNGGQLSADNITLLEVESTGSQSYDAARPITWYKESITYDDDSNNATPKVTINNIKSFYTALGHNGSDYSSNTKFIELLENAVLWATNSTILNTTEFNKPNKISIYPNPATNTLVIKNINTYTNIKISIYNVSGKEVYDLNLKSPLNRQHLKIDISKLSSGFYTVHTINGNKLKSFKLIKQ
ncbi:hypothetical protein MHTCC0001_23770 [Flavobacteriaceae bacterium MHTCC 0001]